MNDNLSLACPRQPNNRLPGTDDLPGLSQRIHHHSVSICQQNGIAGGIAGNIALRYRSA